MLQTTFYLSTEATSKLLSLQLLRLNEGPVPAVLVLVPLVARVLVAVEGVIGARVVVRAPDTSVIVCCT